MLFREYEAWFGLKLCFQNFDEEVENLPGKYTLPDGRLFLALADGKLAGCIALRKLEEKICEMKRLFVREDFRGLGIGKILIEKLITEAGVDRLRKNATRYISAENVKSRFALRILRLL